jgi:hypothetical protein
MIKELILERKTFKCDIGDKISPKNFDQSHHQLTHTKGTFRMLHICENLQLKCHLSDHQRYPAPEKPFEFDICKKQFT